MNTRQLIFSGCAAIILSVSSAQAGPCNTTGKDGLGPDTRGDLHTITTGSAEAKQHPPTETMNPVAGDKAMSSQDAQRQLQTTPVGGIHHTSNVCLQRTRLPVVAQVEPQTSSQ